MFRPQVFRVSGLLVLLLVSLHSAEQDALSIDATIHARHLPYGTILDPIFSSDHTQIVGYTRCGDSAIWTGHYLAAEAFRYRVTRAPAAIDNARAALAALTRLVDVTGIDLLARCTVPDASPYAAGIASEEAGNGVYHASLAGQSWMWIGNTSRDQYSGVFFGLATAYDLISAPDVQASVVALASRLLNNLINNGWLVLMPNGSPSTTFILRPDQELTFLLIGAHLDPSVYASQYSRAASILGSAVPAPLEVDSADDSSYFKFNLDYINLYNLIRLETNQNRLSFYESGYQAVRSVTATHLNPHFNMIDRALHGPNAARDAETRADLDAWLTRPRTDVFVDWRNTNLACGNVACNPLPIPDRPDDEFLWQINPFQLFGGGSGTIEGSGVDYILPYWMARYYRVIEDPPSGRGQ